MKQWFCHKVSGNLFFIRNGDIDTEFYLSCELIDYTGIGKHVGVDLKGSIFFRFNGRRYSLVNKNGELIVSNLRRFALIADQIPEYIWTEIEQYLEKDEEK